MKLLKISIRGHVQGVGYRHFASRAAREYCVTGFVRNEYNGNVYIEACGSNESLEAFCSMLRSGPSRSRVEDVKIVDGGECDGFATFSMH
jgi:acylphosphatase